MNCFIFNFRVSLFDALWGCVFITWASQFTFLFFFFFLILPSQILILCEILIFLARYGHSICYFLKRVSIIAHT
jgi:hypothetical protein